jgi:hypothetical protein
MREEKGVKVESFTVPTDFYKGSKLGLFRQTVSLIINCGGCDRSYDTGVIYNGPVLFSVASLSRRLLLSKRRTQIPGWPDQGGQAE